MLFPYEALNLPDDADDGIIRRAYLEMVKKYTPEKDPDKFRAVNEAYALIKDAEARARLRVFGMKENGTNKLEDLVRPSAPGRKKIGIDAWLSLINC
ncbi:MAG: hypothetical protein A2096_01115 [Spirochaetes bacterium GWF1_41_5]|nr:MAG: hypothetical protein A2096_01115 [Spirochaetes bacterium GWF1_41_5]